MVEASHISCRNGTESSFIEVYSPFESRGRPDENSNWPVTREQAYTLQKKVDAEKWVVLKSASLTQTRNF
jgi:hypothetical protein